MRAVSALVLLVFVNAFLDGHAFTVTTSRAQSLHLADDDGRIAGRVLTVSGEPLAGATVVANIIADAYRPAPRYTATTGSDGSYALTGIQPGRVLVMAHRFGYTYQKVEGDRIETGKVIDMTTARVISGVDLVVYRTGFVTGRVTRPDGRPVAGARIMSHFRSSNGRLMGVTPPVMTDAAGRYLVREVPPGTFRMSATYNVASEMSGQPVPAVYQDWARTFHPATTSFERGALVTVREGEWRQQIDIVLQPQIRRRLAGLVAAENGQALQNVRLEYYAPGRGPFSVIVPVSADGRFMADGVGAPVTLLARGDTSTGTLLGVMQLESTDSFENTMVVLGPPARVAGRFLFEGERPPRDPPMYVQIATEWASPDGTHAAADVARVDDDGRFHVENVIGDRRVGVIGLTPDWEVKEVRRAGSLLLGRLLVLHPGEVVDDLEIMIGRR